MRCHSFIHGHAQGRASSAGSICALGLRTQPPLSAAPSPVCLSKYCRACSCSCCLSIRISAAVCDCSGSLDGLEPETSLAFLALIAVTAAHFSAPLRHSSRTHARATSASGHTHRCESPHHPQHDAAVEATAAVMSHTCDIW